jgi:mannosyl-oligosaccharide alpha-1,2-mannosidase
MGAMADSYFEYLLKLWIQSGRSEDKFKDQYLKVLRDIPNLLKTTKGGLMFIGETKRGLTGPVTDKMEHLTCFMGGNLMLAANTLPDVDEIWATWAEEITRTCHEMYARSSTGLGPEYAMFRTNAETPDDMYYERQGQHYLLRPEVIESVYYMHYFTGDHKYREWAYDMLKALNKHARAPHGYSALKSVNHDGPPQSNWKGEEESFFFAETLKYIYLILSPKRGPLDLSKWVFNTEAQPLPIWPDGFTTTE